MKKMTTNIIFSSTTTVFLLLSISHFPGALSEPDEECKPEFDNICTDKNRAFDLKLIAIFTILTSSLLGVCLLFFARSVSAFQPERSLFLIVKSFASGIILTTGFIHVLPDSFEMLSSHCLNDDPWHKFPFTGFIAMISSVFSLMVDSITTSVFTKSGRRDPRADVACDSDSNEPGSGLQLLRYRRVIAIVLELGIVMHSIVIGLSVGATNNTCTIKGLIAALCFHQMFEGMGLGSCILQGNYGWVKKAVMAFFFAVTTPFGVDLGMAISRSYEENSTELLITVGLLNASSGGLLIYTALVDLLAADFMGQKMQQSIKLQMKAYAALFLGAGGMAILAKWT